MPTTLVTESKERSSHAVVSTPRSPEFSASVSGYNVINGISANLNDGLSSSHTGHNKKKKKKKVKVIKKKKKTKETNWSQIEATEDSQTDILLHPKSWYDSNAKEFVEKLISPKESAGATALARAKL